MKLFTLKAITVASLGALLAVGVPATANAKEAPTFGNPILSSGTVKQNLGSKTPVKLNLTVNGPAGAGDFYALANYKAGASSGTGASLNSPSECNAASDPAKKGKCKGANSSWGSIYGNSSSTVTFKYDWSKPLPVQNVSTEISQGYSLYPGKYKVTVPVNKLARTNAGQLVGGVQKSATGYLTVNADPVKSQKLSKVNVSGSWDKALRYRPTVTAQAPDYQAGAKATFYFKAAGSKSFVNVGSAKASQYGVAVLTPAQNKNLAKGGQVYVTFDAVKFAPKFTTVTKSFTKKQVVLW